MMDNVSCDSLPPSDFKLSSCVDENVPIESAIQVAVETCQLCGSNKRQFTCAKCVNTGQFGDSKNHSSERYAEKLRRWRQLKKERNMILERVEEAVASSRIRKQATQRQSIFEAKQRLDVLKRLIDDAQEKNKKAVANLQSLVDDNKYYVKKADRHQRKKDHIAQYINKSQDCLKECHVRLGNYDVELCALKVQHVQDLQHYIFPIREIQPRSDGDHMEQSMVSALAEARHTAYIRGKWVYTDNSGELHYSIVEPSLPGNGDISASRYNLWLKENQGGLQDEEPEVRSRLYSTCAALSYTTQMVTLLAHFLDINLPCSLCYSEFHKELTEKQFRRAVTRLNHNILHLCFSQDVSPDLLHPTHTIHNLVRLLRAPFLGRSGTFTSNSEMIHSLYDLPLGSEPDLISSSDSSSEASDTALCDNDDLLTTEWEHVPTSLPEVPTHTAQISYFTSAQVQSRDTETRLADTSTTSSIAGGLVTSAAAGVTSLWRFATGKKDN